MLELNQIKNGKNNCNAYNRVGVSSCVWRTECWPEYKSLRKQYIKLISTPIDKYDQRHQGKIFNLHFSAL